MTVVILLLVQYHFIITQFKAVTVFDDFLVNPFFSLSPLHKKVKFPFFFVEYTNTIKPRM